MSLPVIRGSIFVRSTRIGWLLTKVGTQKKEINWLALFADFGLPSLRDQLLDGGFFVRGQCGI
jgi:hypothetical protein